jgi:hypothetical protein
MTASRIICFIAGRWRIWSSNALGKFVFKSFHHLTLLSNYVFTPEIAISVVTSSTTDVTVFPARDRIFHCGDEDFVALVCIHGYQAIALPKKAGRCLFRCSVTQQETREGKKQMGSVKKERGSIASKVRLDY